MKNTCWGDYLSWQSSSGNCTPSRVNDTSGTTSQVLLSPHVYVNCVGTFSKQHWNVLMQNSATMVRLWRIAVPIDTRSTWAAIGSEGSFNFPYVLTLNCKPHSWIQIVRFQIWVLLSWPYGPSTSWKYACFAREQHATLKAKEHKLYLQFQA